MVFHTYCFSGCTKNYQLSFRVFEELSRGLSCIFPGERTVLFWLLSALPVSIFNILYSKIDVSHLITAEQSSATLGPMFSARASATIGLVFLLSACTRVPYGDQLPMTPEIPRETDTDDSVVPAHNACPLLNTEPANTSVTYINNAKKITFTIPYNPKWGTAEAVLPAFVEHAATDSESQGYVLFGPPMPAGLEGLVTDCDVTQSYSLSFLPSRSPQTIVRTIEERGMEVVPNTTVRTINGLTVVQYVDAGLCSFPTLEVLGTEYNYSFTTNCGAGEEEAIAYLENIVKSIQLTK